MEYVEGRRKVRADLARASTFHTHLLQQEAIAHWIRIGSLRAQSRLDRFVEYQQSRSQRIWALVGRIARYVLHLFPIFTHFLSHFLIWSRLLVHR